jgi:S-adenosylmethionine decarboxylase
MIVGTEWLIEVFDADENALRDVEVLRSIFTSIIADLGLKTIGEPFWHQFGGERGITGLTALTESHLACHTYPEYKTATFNLYCCRSRPSWNWEEHLREILNAGEIKITKIERGRNQTEIENPKTKIVGGGKI